MVLKKRLSYGSRGFYLPPIPHIPNSAKRKRTARRNNPFGAFDLLATIAGKLLTGCDNISVNLNGALSCNESKLDIVKKEPLEALNALDQISTNLNPTKTLIGKPGADLNPTKTLIGESGTDLNPTKTLIGESGTDLNAVNKTLIGESGTDLNPSKTLIGESGTKKEQENNNEGLVRSNSSDSSSEMPLYSGGVQNPNPNLFLGNRVYRGVHDDDENSSSKSISRNNVKKSFIAKLRKVASARNNSTNDGGNTKCYTRKRTQKTMFKRKAILYNDELNKRTVHKPQPCGNRVNISIKSFKIPELFIELPESATIATLKKTVMEAVTAVLEGELNLGVTLRGERVKDETKTLKQVGIYQNATGVSDSLNFSLEPTELSAPHVSSQTDDVITEPLASIPPSPSPSPSPSQSRQSLSPSPVPIPTTPVKSHVSDPEPVHSPMEVSSASPELALAVVKAEPLDVAAPACARKERQADAMGQRRIRRPFSVGEVEGLVSAVEQLGTGRWRDVKIRAFDDAKHRTYVDLKDKWKTLVHTASIAPQQRRGEPVPQNLLDRVLAAQAYWAHQHSKLHAKSAAFNAEPGLAILDSEKNIIALESN
ncbi:hypothetical protein LUZ60_003852 [Juncus effusus]|nr:hypothetical protein LUZ60_003852 [Juncus effusus]